LVVLSWLIKSSEDELDVTFRTPKGEEKRRNEILFRKSLKENLACLDVDGHHVIIDFKEGCCVKIWAEFRWFRMVPEGMVL
jgi:hypothetical protein